ncbi:MFS transporter [Luteimonas chenhongjianii]|uniref:MFS transporter n=1 Tax=Luteimonas chenhongjianii TaxID=2006110 RepID=A0A290XHG7_9GAMM|nr:peptide MFS transporter [Luteimonas chenhongjianii]ATD68595.1 MFS transporter [Luteimonas chenhongjianii]
MNPYAAEEKKTILGHPRGLFVLFFAEMWERFSYYGMRALLIFYLVQHWMYSDSEASVIYGAYTALVYIAPVVGGYLADRYLGQRKAVVFGAVLLTFGHFLMAFEGDGGQSAAEINIFWLALSFIIVGSGFLKANISVMVGQLYPRTDIRRDPAYTIFYMGINLGAALGALIAGYLGQTYGWAWGFGAAGVGMLLGLIVFVLGKPLLMGRGESQNPDVLARRLAGFKFEWLLYLAGICAVGVVWWLVQNQAFVGGLLGLVGVSLVLYVLAIAIFKLPYDSFGQAPRRALMLYAAGAAISVLGSGISWLAPEYSRVGLPIAVAGAVLLMGVIIHQFVTRRDEPRDRIFAALILIVGSILFWALFEQAGASLNLFTDRSVDRQIFGWDVPASMFQSLNSIYIILLAPVFAMLWLWLGRRGWEPSTPLKFALAVIQVGLGFLILVWGANSAGTGQMTPVLFIFLIYLVHTMGELCLSPVGLSAMNRLAPAHMASLIMGTWFFASATGNFTAGLISAATGGEGAGPERVLEVYSKVGWLAVGVGILMIVVAPLIRRLMHLDTLKDDVPPLAGEKAIGEPIAPGLRIDEERRLP